MTTVVWSPAARRAHGRRFGLLALIAPLVLHSTASRLQGQDRLLNNASASLGGIAESIVFGRGGYLQPGSGATEPLRLKGITQVTTPVSLSVPLGSAFSMDVGAYYASVTLRYTPDVGGTGETRTATLAGPSDVRVRATGRFFNDAVVITAGINGPTGQTQLGTEGLTVLRASASPALGLSAAPVGSGTSGTMGLIVARQILGWAVAVGGSFERRGSYQPVASLTAGVPSADFQPGDVRRASLGIERLIGRHRLSVTGAYDQFGLDLLKDPSAANTVLSTVRLGPAFTADAQLQLAIAGLKDVVVWGGYRSRAAFTRDSVLVMGTSATYVDGGLRMSLPVARGTDLLVTLDGRWHTGLAATTGLTTSGVAAGGGMLALITEAGIFSLQPYLRAQTGSLRDRGAPSSSATPFSGASAGLIVVARF
ncbi:MAG: hypothetical protein WCK74_09670 [Gemmatimonadaceae bacterium]